MLGGASAEVLARSGLAIHFVCEAYRHGKPLAFFGEASAVLKAARLPKPSAADGVIAGDDGDAVAGFIAALHQHRFPRRDVEGIPA
ncbi:MAG: hypothetical protein WDN25_26220 [Acetobacteraceae bacterium]